MIIYVVVFNIFSIVFSNFNENDFTHNNFSLIIIFEIKRNKNIWIKMTKT